MKRIPATSKNNHKGWKYIPLVKLGEILKQMVWFSGEYVLNFDRNYYEQNKQIPYSTSAHLDIQYRTHQITIKCIWEDEEEASYYSKNKIKHPDRFAIGITEPYHNDFQIRRWRVDDQIIFKHSRFYQGAIDRIEDSILAAQEVIDERITEKEQKKKRELELKSIRENLCKNLDISITKEKYNSSFAYREDNEYNLLFRPSTDNGDIKDNLFEISEIGGEYTEDEIKKIIEIVGGNPRAIAERLKK